MGNVLIISILIVAAILAVLVGYLGWLNSGPKVWAIGASIFLGGIVTALISIISGLKETRSRDAFPVTLILDKESAYPAYPVPDGTNELSIRQSYWSSLGKEVKEAGENVVPMAKAPSNLDEKIIFGGEPIQYAIFDKFLTLYRPSKGGAVVGGGNFLEVS